jgi:phosphate transport system substrate-binding protein
MLRLNTRTVAAMLAVIPALALPASAAATTLIGSGSSAEQPILEVLFSKYTKTHKGIRFKYNPNGGNAGVKDVQAGRSEFAVNTRPPLPSDSGTTYAKLYLDGLCIVVNPKNSLSGLTIAQSKDVFTDVFTNWSQVGGSNLTTTIDPLGRNPTAGLYTFFQSAVLGGATQASNVDQLGSDGLVATGVEKDANAIGYVGLPNSLASGVKRLTINGIACSTANIKTEKYPLFRFAWAVLPTKKPNSKVLQFFNWVRTNKTAAGIISRGGAVPLK